MKKIIALTVLSYLLMIGFGLALVERNVEVEKLSQSLDSINREDRVTAADYMLKFKINDLELNKKAEKILRIGSMKAGDNNHIEEMIWMCKILSSSGDQQYIELFREIALMAPSGKLRKYALESIKLVSKNARHNPSDVNEEQRFLIQMLQSDNIGTRRNAAKTIVESGGMHKTVYASAEETLLAMVDDFQTESLYVDTMAWLCKVLGSSGEGRYLETLRYVRTKTQNSKLIRYANKAIKSLLFTAQITVLDKSSGSVEWHTLSSDNKILRDKSSGLEWYVFSGDSTMDFNRGISACTSLGREINKKMCIPSINHFNMLWKRFKGSDAIKIFDKKNYLSRDLAGC